jgi:hypothetical protein
MFFYGDSAVDDSVSFYGNDPLGNCSCITLPLISIQSSQPPPPKGGGADSRESLTPPPGKGEVGRGSIFK